MELPPYRLPTFKGLMIHTFERTFQYVKKAGTTILGISILLWAMMTFPGLPDSEKIGFESRKAQIQSSVPDGETTPSILEKRDAAIKSVEAEENETALRNSMAGRIGSSLEGVTSLAGFDWRTNIALVGGFAAKEVIVSTLGTAYSMGDVDPEATESLGDSLVSNPAWSPLSALSLIIFTIFYAPCFVTVVCIVKESGSWKWGAFSMAFNTTLAFLLAVLVYQTGTLMGF
jgi:ferrous iron transport protein B